MALSPRIEARQSPSLTMTPQLQQAIKLLQMSNLQLAEFVAAEVETNPLLEIAPPPPRSASLPRGQGETRMDGLAAEISLGDALRAQIRAARSTAPAAQAAELLADELDEDGYLRGELGEIASRHRLDRVAAAAGLALVQSCEPVGVGARNLRECLALQLRELDRLDPAMQALLDHLDLVGRGHLVELQALCGVDAADFAEMLAELRALDPKPGQRYGRTPVQMALPDVYVLRRPSGEWNVELNADTLPRVLVDRVYAAHIGGGDAASRLFVAECSARANWLVRSLDQRARAILRVATDIVQHQQRFFALGQREMRPLTRVAVADRLGMHDSTVSRVAAGKYLACDQGLFAFRFFFGASIQALAGGEAHSATAVQARIRHLIQVEAGGRTISDDRLARLLMADGIDIARRTVAKYREGMGIPSSVKRRRLKAYGDRN